MAFGDDMDQFGPYVMLITAANNLLTTWKTKDYGCYPLKAWHPKSECVLSCFFPFCVSLMFEWFVYSLSVLLYRRLFVFNVYIHCNCKYLNVLRRFTVSLVHRTKPWQFFVWQIDGVCFLHLVSRRRFVLRLPHFQFAGSVSSQTGAWHFLTVHRNTFWGSDQGIRTYWKLWGLIGVSYNQWVRLVIGTPYQCTVGIPDLRFDILTLRFFFFLIWLIFCWLFALSVLLYFYIFLRHFDSFCFQLKTKDLITMHRKGLLDENADGIFQSDFWMCTAPCQSSAFLTQPSTFLVAC